MKGMCLRNELDRFDKGYTFDNSCIPNAITYETFISSLLKRDKNDYAVKLLPEIIAKGVLKE
jgi:hypothetical protein